MNARLIFILVCSCCITLKVEAQDIPQKPDTTGKIARLFKRLSQSIYTDTTVPDHQLVRNDIPYWPYNGKVIRHIFFTSQDFGDSVRELYDKPVQHRYHAIIHFLHHTTRAYTLRQSLFFRENQLLSPYLIGNNERYLRDLPYLQFAAIRVMPIQFNEDSVDVIITTHDNFSLGGSLNLRSAQSADATIKEDNLLGNGDQLQIQGLYDQARSQHAGVGASYTKRNIGNSFLSGSIGYLNFNNAFNTGEPEETIAYARIIKPLVNPFMHWTYALAAEHHRTDNYYNFDSLYSHDYKYDYTVFDIWAGLNLSTKHIAYENEFNRLRWLLSGRLMTQKFSDKPNRYLQQSYYAYSNISAALASVSVFRLNYYKTRFIYGMGRLEDIPEGLEVSYTAGFVRKENRNRLYNGVSFSYDYFTRKEAIFNYTIKAGSYFYRWQPEDVNLLARIDYFGRLHQMTKRWKQREFLSLSYAREVNPLLEEPLFMESSYGLHGFRNNYLPGTMRVTASAESEFFSPWQLFNFRMAPFTFGAASFFKLDDDHGGEGKIYPSFGGGMRVRNEALVFGTIEFRATIFPQGDFFNNRVVLELNTNVRFKYIQNFIHQPDFVNLN